MFKFELGQEVALNLSVERGFVRGRAQYEHGENSYYIVYKAADGRMVEAWWQESLLHLASGFPI